MSIFDVMNFLNRKCDKHLVRVSTTGSERESYYFEVDFNDEYSIMRAFNMFHSQATIHVIVFKTGVTLKTWLEAIEAKADFAFLNQMILAEQSFKTANVVKQIRNFA